MTGGPPAPCCQVSARCAGAPCLRSSSAALQACLPMRAAARLCVVRQDASEVRVENGRTPCLLVRGRADRTIGALGARGG